MDSCDAVRMSVANGDFKSPEKVVVIQYGLFQQVLRIVKKYTYKMSATT